MANVYVTDTYLSNIADAIRAKNGLSETYRPIEMGPAIDEINLIGDVTADMIAMRDFGSSISGTASKIDKYAFAYCYSLITANFSNCTHIGSSAFQYCSSLTTISFPNCVSIESYAFQCCSSLTTISFPNCTSINNYAFRNCYNLAIVSFPNCTRIGNYVFSYCYYLTTVSFPSCTNIGAYAFGNCSVLTTANFPNCSSISTNAFRYCYNLLSLYLNGVSSVTSLGTSAFYSTPIEGYTTSTGGVYGSVFVPSSLYSSFITATNWASISARIVSM